MTLEICVNSYQSALNAEAAGAQRIELCTELSVGGLTPSYGELQHTIKALSIPVYVLIRPRSGDFCYSEEEFEVMKTNIGLCRAVGASGIVSGVLNKDRTLDTSRIQELMNLAKSLDFTFHRAFDEVIDPFQALEQLIELGVKRILTSGQKLKAEDGLELLEALVQQADGRIGIMAGSGITAQNVAKFKAIGITEVHASASVPVDQNSDLFAVPQSISHPQKIKDLLNAL
ncbi:copper homeostasis protein CutC [Winogradskyella aurantiaca]|uniref:copper homeostasis protein CutC n=1 Tax=Winogradskyella aurantiaca TaxID=2219558 RepID=UPI000E1D1B8A|nr:copper homeostasis protein CutC [Winogradskyella aurantiaca]